MKYENDEKFVHIIDDITSIYFHDLQITLLSSIYKLPIDIVRETMQKAATIVPLQVKSITIYLATMHPCIYDRKTMSQIEISPQSRFNITTSKERSYQATPYKSIHQRI